ncbi:hypothetical protein TNCV_2857251 [Trichonephila clavipes]|nr:hypothetical protein TNCV_2857251 [Trichonephila clavipes]
MSVFVVERPGLRWSFLVGDLEGVRGLATVTSDVIEIFLSKWTRDSRLLLVDKNPRANTFDIKFRIKKYSTAALDCTFTRSFTNRENIWSMVAKRLARNLTPVITFDEMRYRVEAAWSSVPVHAILSLFDSMPRRISAVTTTRGGCFSY